MFKTSGRILRECPPKLYLDAVRRQGIHYASLGSIPPEVREILVTREDPKFYSHKGILPKSMFRAFRRGLHSDVPMAGASTITQQLMKNLYLSCDRSVLRKLKDIVLALLVENRSMLTKDEILELYFNCVRYGPDIYGIADAAEYYFGKTADKLTCNQAVILATAAISPYWRRPIEDPIAFTKHRNDSLYELVGFRAMGPGTAQMLAHVYNPLIGLDPELRRMKDIFGVNDEPKTADGLVSYARSMTGSPYWKGAFGQTAVLGLLNHLRWDHPDEYTGAGFLEDLGKRVFDDAGLIKGYLWSSSTDAMPYHDRNHDWTGAMFYENAAEKGCMDSFDGENGRLLYTAAPDGKAGHVGIYSSEGLVYHAKDRASGVVCEPFAAEEWDLWSGIPAYESALPADPEIPGRKRGYRNIPADIDDLGRSHLVSYTALSPNCSDRRGRPVTRITPHYAAGDPTVEVLGRIFADGSREASANYGIGSDGRIGMFVEESRRSWASGDPDNDERAVTIECANQMDGSLTDECWDSLVALCADICIRNGIRDCSYTGDTDGVLTMHRWFADTECPGPWLSEQFERLSREVNSKINTGTGEGADRDSHITPCMI